MVKERDQLLHVYNDLKDKLNREYEEQMEQKRSYQQEVETLNKLNSKIKEYVLVSCNGCLVEFFFCQYLAYHLAYLSGTMI